jgi:adenylate kinase family enzyme
MQIAILLNGPPIAGKGVQGKFIEEYLDCSKIMTSVVLDEDGHTDIMRKGEMVDDHIVFESVTRRVEEGRHHLFDGFTRTPEQSTIFPKELHKIGFDLVIMIELNLIDEEIALERRLKRKTEGDSNDRPDGDRKETFLKRFRRHNHQADKVRSIHVHSCDHVFPIDARKDKNEVARLIKGFLKVVAFNEINQYVDDGAFLGESEQIRKHQKIKQDSITA